ncbi:MAG: hypothetical protein WDO68_21920 [Gammaproteobacteria bacterium]
MMSALLAGAIAASCALASGADVDTTPEPESPTLRTLAAALGRHDDHALDAFWKRIKSSHNPIIESVPGHPDDALFTFIWEAEPNQSRSTRCSTAGFRCMRNAGSIRSRVSVTATSGTRATRCRARRRFVMS